jgi:hypothetical protein
MSININQLLLSPWSSFPHLVESLIVTEQTAEQLAGTG